VSKSGRHPHLTEYTFRKLNMDRYTFQRLNMFYIRSHSISWIRYFIYILCTYLEWERIRNESLCKNESGTLIFSLILVKTIFKLSCKSLILNEYFYLCFKLRSFITSTSTKNRRNKESELTK